jgi:hypothetical protein
MDPQLFATLIIVAVAAAFVASSVWRSATRTGSKGCGSGCGSCAPPRQEVRRPGMIPLDQVNDSPK